MAAVKYYVGIDPGVVNTGVALTKVDDSGFKVLSTFVFSPRGVTDKALESKAVAAGMLYRQVSEMIDRDTDGTTEFVVEVTIERYVSYRNVLTSESEEVILFIGSLLSLFTSVGIRVVLVRAVDWKVFLAKQLFKTGNFKNPSEKLDKKFSDAAATFIAGVKPKTNHESDAICLAHSLFLKSGLTK